jgi:hypothetical protein
MNFNWLHLNLYPFLSFKKHYYFKTKPFLTTQSSTPLEFFLMDRFVQHHPLLHDPNNWTVNKKEKQAWFKHTDKIPDLEAEYALFKTKKLTDQIDYLLNDEYGYLLPELSNGEWVMQEVALKKLIIPNEQYSKNLAREIIDDYLLQLEQGRELIGGLFLPKGEYFRLIDGYHRLSALKQKYSGDHLVSIITFNRF